MVKRKYLLIIMLILSMLAVGCETNITAMTMEKPDEQILDAFDKEIVKRQNQFGFDLYQVLKEEKNVLISPFSIGAAMNMVYSGTDGASQKEMAEAMHIFGLDEKEASENLLAQLYYLKTGDEKVELLTANSAWFREDVPFLESYRDRLEMYHLAETKSLDFMDPQAANIINQWVKQATNKKITDIVEDPIDPLTILFLMNALYFNGEWTYSFDTQDTYLGTFTDYKQEVNEAFMMHQTGQFSYYADETKKAIRLPYGEEKRFGMYVLLPQDAASLSELKKSITSGTWEELKKELDEQKGALSLPRFSLTYETPLKPMLNEIGIRKVFDPYRSDFSNMVSKEYREDIYISEVLHKTLIEVDEKGTEAAAVTSVEIGVTSLPALDFEMKVDRPFVLILEDEVTETILFLGHVDTLKDS